MKLLEREVTKYTCLSNDHAFNEYGFRPHIDIKEGIKRTVAYTVDLLRRKDRYER